MSNQHPSEPASKKQKMNCGLFKTETSSFTFGFDLDTPATVLLPKLNDDDLCKGYDVSHPHAFAIILRDIFTVGGIIAKRGDLVKIDWLLSNNFSLYVSVCDKTTYEPTPNMGLVDKCDLKLLKHDQHVEEKSNILEIDTVFQLPSEITPNPHFCPTPLEIEPGLSSFCWPISNHSFLTDIFKKKCFVSHGTGERLNLVKEDFHQFNIKKMLDYSSKCVVWMKSGEKMQYLSANSDVALSCFNAGHTIYFNPEMEVQKKWVRAISHDLQIDFGVEKELGGYGGDVEVFAVNKTHHTPWHFDAQENFSIQLVGTKRWSVVPCGSSDVLTNLHLNSTNRESVNSDIKIHMSTGDVLHSDCITRTGTKFLADFDNHPLKQEFVVYPGTVFYHPAGYWHKVEALDDSGSLSINFSLDPMRYYEVFMNRFTSILMKHQLWRQRISSFPSSPLSVFSSLLSDLPNLIKQLRTSDFIPPALLFNNRSNDKEDKRYLHISSVNDVQTMFVSHLHDFVHLYNIPLDVILQYNPMMSMARNEPAYGRFQPEEEVVSIIKPLAVKIQDTSYGNFPIDNQYKSIAETIDNRNLNSDHIITHTDLPFPIDSSRLSAEYFNFVIHGAFGNDTFTSMSSIALIFDVKNVEEYITGYMVDGVNQGPLSASWISLFVLETLLFEYQRHQDVQVQETVTLLKTESKFTITSLSESVIPLVKLLVLQVHSPSTISFDEVELNACVLNFVKRTASLLMHCGMLRNLNQ